MSKPSEWKIIRLIKVKQESKNCSMSSKTGSNRMDWWEVETLGPLLINVCWCRIYNTYWTHGSLSPSYYVDGFLAKTFVFSINTTSKSLTICFPYYLLRNGICPPFDDGWVRTDTSKPPWTFGTSDVQTDGLQKVIRISNSVILRCHVLNNQFHE